MEEKFIEANGIQIHYLTEGEGPLLLLLHGFPQTSHVWRKYLSSFSKRYKVVAPDLRGYGQSDKPQDVEKYKPSVLYQDIVDLIKALGYEKAAIVGHDWGGVIAWRTVMERPDVVERLVIINAPHPAKFAQAIKTFAQLKKSWYVMVFQLPGVPEFLFNRYSDKFGDFVFRHKIPNEDRDIYVNSLKEPGAFKAVLNYYRAAFKEHLKNKQIAVPTLVIWGERDVALGKELTFGMNDLFSGPFRVEYVPDAGHWVPDEKPELVAKLINEFLSTK